ncbi:FadR/GntR family transcriptional regulator [Metabacillus iocasae]|uniref:DNA-binding FadR family transcriptional regulator n=1 Tax=Priestia iocasae TaxID=2291674 RepID=A0ABS2QQC7_9BACI|nr:GntR family transcriptional regulator [Metabacillus iocasae]MBM7701227.1 DNA-binding FadR family transcriptional regulator [Metabacillus iocasae]
MSERSKVYVEILEQIREMMEADGLKTGDKIPSERELAERLNAGRSSVREALRALELLGIIETRRGEGTFIKEVGEHQLIDVLATFLLQDHKAKDDLAETKYWLERTCLYLSLERMTSSSLQTFQRRMTNKEEQYDYLFEVLFDVTDNHLLYRIWRAVAGYARTMKDVSDCNDKERMEMLIEAIISGNKKQALHLHEQFYR